MASARPRVKGWSVCFRHVGMAAVVAAAVSCAVLRGAIATPRPRPNAIFIPADDLGYADLGESHNFAAGRPELVKKNRELLRTARVDSPLWPIKERPSTTGPASQPVPRPVVGAIRWDAWHGDKGVPGRAVEKSLSPKRWHDRLPFFAKVISDDRVEVRGDTQAVVDREIAYAAQAGLDYWAFCYYPDTAPMNYGLELYLSSEHRKGMNFCLLLQSAHLGAKRDWADMVATLVGYMKQPTYQKVMGDRPLVYLFLTGKESLRRRFGSADDARQAFNVLREAAKSAGLGNPYLVLQDWSPAVAAQEARELGFDAISAYATTGGGLGKQPYSALADHSRRFWEQCRKTGSRVVPLVMTGWDRRPRIENPVPWETQKPDESVESALHYVAPEPNELAALLRNAIQWTWDNRQANPANAILIYAWNELDEGGWLVPTLSEGNSRLRAIRSLLVTPTRPTM